MRSLEEYEKLIGYRFRDRKLLETALTHSSYANEHKCKSYERLEFLGDSVLGFVTAEYLYGHFPSLPEGQLTKTGRRWCASAPCAGSPGRWRREAFCG